MAKTKTILQRFERLPDESTKFALLTIRTSCQIELPTAQLPVVRGKGNAPHFWQRLSPPISYKFSVLPRSF